MSAAAQPSPLLAELFGEGVAAAEMREPGDASLLHAEEAAHVRQAIGKRVGEFAAGRLCARSALLQLGIEDFPLRAGGDGRPLWPAGILGSITHTQGFGGAVAASGKLYAAIGVDAERIARVGTQLWPKIATAAERAWLDALPEAQRSAAGAVIFSVKEAFYKCQYGLTESWVGFQDVELEAFPFDGCEGGVRVRPLAPLKLAQLRPAPWSVRFRVSGALVVSGMAFPA